MAYTKGVMSNVLKDFSVTIDGTKITNTQLEEIRIRWSVDNFRITATLTFKDLTGMIEEVPIRGGNTVVMAMTDFDDVVSNQEFKVINVSQGRGVANPTVSLDLIDPITLTSMQMYNEMGWASEHMIGIIDHPETLKPSLVGKKKDFCPPPPPHKEFIMPLHVSFNVVTHWLARNANKMWYQTRKDFVIQPLNKLFTRGKKGKKFYLKPPNENYRRIIYDYKLSLGKLMNATTLQPTSKVASFDPCNKHSKWGGENFAGARGKLGETAAFGLTADAQASTGAKYFYKTDYHVNDVHSQQYAKHAYKDVTMEILVPGQFGTNIGDIVEVELSNWKLQSTPEKNVNGNWFVVEIIDIISGVDFVQRITLGRSKYFK